MAKHKLVHPRSAYLTPPTVKGQRFSMLRIHCEQHPNDTQSVRHLTHAKWNQYR